MRIPRFAAAAGGAATIVALALAGCTGTDGGAGSGEAITVDWGEPENPLIPANTNEVNGGLVLNNIMSGLMYYEADGTPQMDVAESIESDDYQTWTITIKDGETFTDGTPVTASSFVDAWQWGASDPANLNQWWFGYAIPFEGYSDEGGEDTLALEVIDDLTFTATLTQPQADFPVALGYTVFFPLPEAFFEDPEAFGDAPIGNGPYMIDEWVHDEVISLVPNPDYDGPRAAQNSGLDLVVYATQEAAYTDLLAGNLDIIQQVPSNAMGTYEEELGDRAVTQAAAVFQSFTMNANLPHFGFDEEGKLRRAAISMAINRDEITDVVFSGTREPAVDWTSPVISGFSDSIEGSEVLRFDPEGAVEAWAAADAISPWEGTFELAYNADGGHQEWVDATVNSIKNVLGIDAVGVPYPDFAGLRTEVNQRTITSAFRTGWQFDFPSQSNILGALYVTGSGSNDADYSNPEFDALFQAGLTSPTFEEQTELFQQAQAILNQDLPAIPLWYSAVNAGYGEDVSNVEYGWDTWPVLYEVTK